MTDLHATDEKLGLQGQTAQSEVPSATLPTARITAIRCSAGHKLGGLFVLFRLVPLHPSIAPEELTWHLGLTTPEGWLGPADPHEYLPHDGPVAVDPATLSSILPDTYKLVSEQRYSCYFIQHPSLALAKTIQAAVSGTAPHDFGPPQELTAGSGTLNVPEDPKSFIPQGHDLYQGWVLYNGMPHAQCLGVGKQVARLQAHLGALRYLIGTGNFPYLADAGVDADKSGAPNQGVFDKRTMAAVFRLQVDAQAGKAFAVSGTPHSAYVDGNYDPVVDRAQLAAWNAQLTAIKKLKPPAKKAPAEQVDAYQAQQAERKRLEVLIAEERKDVNAAQSVANAWSYLEGEAAGETAVALTPDGVADTATGNVVKGWLDRRLRKPDPILVLTQDNRDWGNWLRSEAAIALRALSELSVALGFHYGISVNHTFRSALVDIGKAGYGRSARSIHKTGAAIDLGMTQFSGTVEAFPIVYAHEDDGDRVWWRLHGPSTQPISSDPATAKKLAEPLIAVLRAQATAAAPLPRAFDVLSRVANQLASELETDPVKFFQTYYHSTVQRWFYDAYHPVGGTPGPTVSADTEATNRVKAHDQRIQTLKTREAELKLLIADPKRAAELKKNKDELAQTEREIDHETRVRTNCDLHRKSFLDLTKLADVCGLSRIHSFKSGWAQSSRSGRVEDPAGLAKLIQQAESDLASHNSMEDVAVISCKKKVLKTTVSNIDSSFLASWGAALKALKKDIPKTAKVTIPQLTVTLSHTADKKKDAQKLAAKLRELGNQKLIGLVRVEGTKAVQTASEWAQYVEDRVKALEAAWLAMQPTAEEAKVKKPARVPGKKPVPQESVLSLHPVFLKNWVEPESGDVPAENLWLLPGSSVAVPIAGQPIGMEWWHFQYNGVMTTTETVINKKSNKPVQVPSRRLWGDLLVDIGYAREVLRHGNAPQLYYRAGIGYPDDDLDDAKAQ